MILHIVLDLTLLEVVDVGNRDCFGEIKASFDGDEEFIRTENGVG